MKTTLEYIDELAELKGWKTDYQIAKGLNIKTTTMTRYRRHGGTMDNDTAWKVADALGVDAVEVIAAVEIERAERSDNTEKAAVWKRRFQAVSTSAATVFGLIALPYGQWLTDQLCILC
jgi:transcriptional regulator with XRE-family HTH domain